MYISEIKEISNYRNLSGKTIKFDKKVNFLIGENNIGKTNILELINIFLSVGKFSESDFTDIINPIQIKMTIKYSEEEIGFFEDNFDVDDCKAITLVAIQDSVGERLNYYHDIPNQTKISMSVIKKMNVLYYYAQRLPSKEVDFRKTSGSGKVLNFLIQNSLEAVGIQEKNVLDRNKLDSVVTYINEQIKSLNTITGDNINAYIDEEADKVICRILGLGDENKRELSALGEGVQYAFNILLQIIEIIYSIKSSRKQEDFEEHLIYKNGKKLFPLFLILDEPEIHQHPYRQRSLIKKIESLMNNENQEFIKLLNTLFHIDGMIGQIFIATHSPNILLNDYKQFIRIYHSLEKEKSNNDIDIVSGCEIKLDKHSKNKISEEEKFDKHFFRGIMYLKEAMFSKCILFVEGDTENGAMPVFAEKMGLDFDEKGIGVVKLDGAKTIEGYKKLYSSFGIKTIAILDKDQESEYANIPDTIFTSGKDFEEDIYDNFLFNDYINYKNHVGKIGKFVDSIKAYDDEIKKNKKEFIKTPSLLFNINEKLQKIIMENIKEDEVDELREIKNSSRGAILAEYVTKVPESFQAVINRLKEEVK